MATQKDLEDLIKLDQLFYQKYIALYTVYVPIWVKAHNAGDKETLKKLAPFGDFLVASKARYNERQNDYKNNKTYNLGKKISEATDKVIVKLKGWYHFLLQKTGL